MDDYQTLVVAQFFEPLPSLSQTSCHQFVLHHIAPILFPNTTDKVDVQPSPFQGSMSYTAILHTHSMHTDHRTAVQFRSDKQDLFGVIEASRIHGHIVPLVTYRGMYEGLFVYTSPFAEGTPYISVLMSSQDYELPLRKKIVTVLDLADLVTRGARANTTPDTTISDLTSTLDKIRYRSITMFSETQLLETAFPLVLANSYHGYAISPSSLSHLPTRISPHSITLSTTPQAGFKLY